MENDEIRDALLDILLEILSARQEIVDQEKSCPELDMASYREIVRVTADRLIELHFKMKP